MNNVIAIHQNQQTMSSTQLASLLGIEKKEVNRKIKDLFSVEIDGGEFSPYLDSRGYVTDYHLPELETTMFVGKWHTPFLRQLAQFWIDNKEKQPKLPTTFAEALQLAADQAKQLELAAPKIAFVDNLVDRTALMPTTVIAQKHGKSAIWLNKILTEHHVYNQTIKRGKAFNTWFIEKGYGSMKQSSQGFSQALFTNSGEVFINELLITNGYVELK